MKNSFFKQCQRGFTLVELLIVVIIVAILAAIVIPQFSNSSLEAKEAALDSNLSAVRAAMELYKLQHNNQYPGSTAASGATCPTGSTAGTGAIDTAQAFIDQMTMASDATGKTCSVATTTFKYGPYLKGSIPNEPVSGKGAVVAEIAVTNSGAPIVPTVDTGGWALDTKSGQFVANSNKADSRSPARAYYLH